MFKSRKFKLLKTLSKTAGRYAQENLSSKLWGSTIEGKAAEALAGGLDELKGAAMKMGQMMSLHGDDTIIPPQWRDALAKLQQSATPKPWSEMQHLFHRGLPHAFDLFESIEEEAVHAASIGQVHKGLLKDGREVAVKIRYPDIASAIESDLKSITSVFKTVNLVSRHKDIDSIIADVKNLFYQEMDFNAEKKAYQKAYAQFQEFHHLFQVPQPIEEGCSETVLTLEWMEGRAFQDVLRDVKEKKLSKEVRNALAEKMLTLMILEIHVLGSIQSDPNPGNFLLAPDGRVILLDFGAHVQLSHMVQGNYRKLTHALCQGQWEEVERVCRELGFLWEKDSTKTVEALNDILRLTNSPFDSDKFDWEDCSLFTQVKKTSLRFVAQTKARPVSAEILFLNRKVMGMQLLMEQLKGEVRARDLFLRLVPTPEIG